MVKIEYKEGTLSKLAYNELEQKEAYWLVSDMNGLNKGQPSRFFVPILDVESTTLFLLEYNDECMYPRLLRPETFKGESFIYIYKHIEVRIVFNELAREES